MIAGILLAAAASTAAPRQIAAVTPERYFSEVVAPHRGKALVVNFWATWCEPCREELPALARAWREGRGSFDVVLVSADSLRLKDSVVPAVLDGISSPFRCYVESSEDPQRFIDAVDPKWEGELPHTIVYGRDGKAVASAVGKRTTEQFLKLVALAR